MKTLTIISHTEHFISPDGNIVGLGPTVTEINHLLAIFDEIYHVAMLHSGVAPASALPYISNKIKFIQLPTVGGIHIKDKFAIIWKAPIILSRIRKALKQSDYFQFRAPTGIGVFMIPYFILFSSKKGWFKYAGNWKQKNAPLAYSIQRWLLKKQKRNVTINGKWFNQPKQCLTFENPCLTEYELEEGKWITNKKRINENLINFCFVGRLEEEKGIGILINAIIELSKNDKSKIGKIHIVGDSKTANFYKRLTKDSNLNFMFHGFLSRMDVQDIYKQSHAIILPSASEGFPKVIAEAMNYGCLPIVTNISSIGHYVKDNVNGFLLNSITIESLIEKIKTILIMSDSDYSKMIMMQKEELQKFTFSYYNTRIINEILN